MLEFKKINIKDISKIYLYTKKLESYFCEHNFVDIFIWKDYYKTEISFDENFLYIRIRVNNEYIYLFPIGNGNILNAINKIEKIVKFCKYKIISINTKQKKLLNEKMPNKFLYLESRNNYDYIYLSNDLITLNGKKFHSKRNFVNRFKKIHDTKWSHEAINEQNKDLIIEFFDKWCFINKVNLNEFSGEKHALLLAINNFNDLKLKGEILYLNNEVIAFSIGNQFNNNMFVIQFEKANSNIIGSYQMINFIFAQKYCNNTCYINREEDLGIEGLRKAKMSYNPAFLAEKYTAIRNI